MNSISMPLVNYGITFVILCVTGADEYNLEPLYFRHTLLRGAVPQIQGLEMPRIRRMHSATPKYILVAVHSSMAHAP
jgi:hypothetical protein